MEITVERQTSNDEWIAVAISHLSPIRQIGLKEADVLRYSSESFF